MKRWGIAAGIVAMFWVAAPPASANPYTGSGGAVVGTIEYDRPLPGLLKLCAPKLGFDVQFESSAFLLRDGDRTTVGPMAFTGRGVSNCASLALEGGRIEGSLTFAARPEFTCGIAGHYVRTVTDLQFVATASCTDAGVSRPRFNWVVRLQQVEGHLTGFMS